MLFRTYGTKASIKVDPLALHHIEPYTPNLINMNYTILDIDENDIANEPTTSLTEIPNFLLDEWANAYLFNPISKTLEKGLGTYCISENDALIPNLMKNKEDTSETWSMYFDGSRNKNGLGVGVILVSLALERYYFSFKI